MAFRQAYEGVPGLGRTITSGAATAAYRLVKNDGTYCGADTTNDIAGQTMCDCSASGQPCALRTLNNTNILVSAAGAVTAGALVYKAANGQVGTTNTNLLVGIALSDAAAANDVISVQPKIV